LAFGKKASKKVPADSTVYFDVELVDFFNPGTFNVEFLDEGTGELIPSDAEIEYMYNFKRLDGSYITGTTGETIKQPLRHNLECITKAGETMRLNSHVMIHCPSSMAWGEVGTKQGKWSIAPNEDIIIEMAIHGWTLMSPEQIEENERLAVDAYERWEEEKRQ
jgi:FKBP-type peptidyl-prolyl cis-trans isomerase